MVAAVFLCLNRNHANLLLVILLYFSAFHLSYNMLLNQMRCEDGDPENLLRNSFYQFQADRSIPDLEVNWHSPAFVCSFHFISLSYLNLHSVLSLSSNLSIDLVF